MIYEVSPSCHDRAVISQYPPYKDLVQKVEGVSCVGENIEKCIIEFFSNNKDDVIEVMSVIWSLIIQLRIFFIFLFVSNTRILSF